MKGFFCKTTSIITISFLFAIQLAAQPDLLGQFFNNLKNKVIANADKLNNWKNDAENAAKKTIKDFTDCPSPAAQNLYDDLKRKQDQARETKRLADEADHQAQDARENCKRATRLNAQCDSAYNSLAFRATSNTAAATFASLEIALNSLRKLRCPAGCDKTARIVYPTAELGEKKVKVGDMLRTSAQPAGFVPLPLVNEITYCSAWNPGNFRYSWAGGNGEFRADFYVKYPYCERTNTISSCTEWDLSLVLPKLKQLNLVPPSVELFEITVKVSLKDVDVVTGVKEAECQKPIKINKQSTITFNFELSSDPLSVLTEQGGEKTTIGCESPAFGLEPITTTIKVPDGKRVWISWTSGKIKGGIEVDMTKPEFRGMCKKGMPSDLKVPTVKTGKGYLDMPNVCMQPRLVDLIGRK